MTPFFEWKQEVIDKAIAMAGAGKTAAAIGIELGTSRNSVIGKLGRLGVRLGVTERPSNAGKIEWTTAANKKLRKLWLDGLSLRQIAADLGMPYSAAISHHAHLIGLPKRTTEGQTLAAALIRRPKTAKPLLLPPAIVPPPAARTRDQPRGSVAFLDRRFGQCAWPLWHDEERVPFDQKFVCGSPAGAKPYCAKHSTQAVGVGTAVERRAHEVAA